MFDLANFPIGIQPHCDMLIEGDWFQVGSGDSIVDGGGLNDIIDVGLHGIN